MCYTGFLSWLLLSTWQKPSRISLGGRAHTSNTVPTLPSCRGDTIVLLHLTPFLAVPEAAQALALKETGSFLSILKEGTFIDVSWVPYVH